MRNLSSISNSEIHMIYFLNGMKVEQIRMMILNDRPAICCLHNPKGWRYLNKNDIWSKNLDEIKIKSLKGIEDSIKSLIKEKNLIMDSLKQFG